MENKLRILVVTYRYGADVLGGGERFLRGLLTRLAAKGHQVEVYTTRSQNIIASPRGYLIWDDFLAPGSERDEGVEVNRYPVRNPVPWRGARLAARMRRSLEAERRSERFRRLLGETLRGTGDFCLLSGWYHLENWEDGPARWTQERARLLAGGSEVRGLRATLYAPWGVSLVLAVDGWKELRLTVEPGKRKEVELSLPPRDLVDLHIRCDRVVRRPGDERKLGVAVRNLALLEKGNWRELSLDRDWDRFFETAPENLLGRLLWPLSEGRSSRLCRRHGYLMGPRSPQLERAAVRAASRCDLVMGAMVPVHTLLVAWRASRKAGKPFLAVPLFHPRDYNHYWPQFRRAMLEAAGVEANSPAIREMMEEWGFPAFSIGPGLDIEEFASQEIDGARFRREFGLEGVPILLWVGRKNAAKGYPLAIECVGRLREQGIPAVLVMIGPDDDGLPLPAEGVVYLGPLPRQKLLDAYDACNLFVFPSLNESFCLVFCEAWMLGKPVLGNLYCAAARGQIKHGVDGYLCFDADDFARRARELLLDGEKARAMGERGREKVRRERDWGRLVEAYEERMFLMLEGGTTRGSASRRA